LLTKPKKLKSKRTKVWHNFQIHLGGIKRESGSKFISLDKIFDDPLYADKQSITVRLGESYYDSIKNRGWSRIIKDGSHWLNKDRKIKRCQECLIYSKLPLRKFDSNNDYLTIKNWWLCESCYAMRMERVTKWKEQKLLTTQKIASNI
jgi:hypothetical protein